MASELPATLRRPSGDKRQIEREGEGEEQHGLAAERPQPRGQATEERPAHPPAATQAQEGIEACGPEEDERRARAEPHRGQRHARQGGVEQHRPGAETPAPERDARGPQKHGGRGLEQGACRAGAGLPGAAEAAADGREPDRQRRGRAAAEGLVAPGQAAAPEPAAGLRRIELQRRDPQEGKPQERQADDDIERHLPEAEPGLIGRPRLLSDGGIRFLSSAPRARRGRGHSSPGSQGRASSSSSCRPACSWRSRASCRGAGRRPPRSDARRRAGAWP